jgi:hypothetical protein
MDETIINENIDVGAVFGKGKVVPKWFLWKKRKYDIKETTFRWQDKEGDDIIQYFAVTDGATSFELALNQKTLSWTLKKTVVV